MADFFSKIVQDYDWHHLSLIIDEGEPMNMLVRQAFERMFRSLGDNYRINLDFQEFTRKISTAGAEEEVNFDKILLNSKKSARGTFK